MGLCGLDSDEAIDSESTEGHWRCEAVRTRGTGLFDPFYLSRERWVYCDTLFFLLWYMVTFSMPAIIMDDESDQCYGRNLGRYCSRDSEAVVPSDLHGPARSSKLFVS